MMMLMDELQLSISEVSQLTKVSARQLRYWEKQGYIKNANDGKTRKYTLSTLLKVFHVKRFLNQGYTLKTAVQKAELEKNKRQAVKNFFEERNQVEVSQEGQSYLLDLGLSDDGKYHVFGQIDEKGSRLKVKEVD